MDKGHEKKKQQMILIISVFLVAIIVAWTASLDWSLHSVNKTKEDGTVKDLVNGIEESVVSFNDNVSNKKIDFGNVVKSLKSRFNGEKKIVDSMMDKISAMQMDSWKIGRAHV